MYNIMMHLIRKVYHEISYSWLVIRKEMKYEYNYKNKVLQCIQNVYGL